MRRRDPGIPNAYPGKAALLEQLSQARANADDKKVEARAEKAAERKLLKAGAKTGASASGART